jgi:hypothetical protein
MPEEQWRIVDAIEACCVKVTRISGTIRSRPRG